MSEITNCPLCGLDNIYFDGSMYICPDCGHEWIDGEESEDLLVVKDCNGNILSDGDSVTVIKSLDVKGSSMVIKQGTKVKNIRLTENSGEVDCKVEGSNIVLKTCFLKKS